MNKRASKSRKSKRIMVYASTLIGAGLVATLFTSYGSMNKTEVSNDIAYDCVRQSNLKTGYGWPLPYKEVLDSYNANPYLSCSGRTEYKWMSFAGDVVIFSLVTAGLLYITSKFHWADKAWGRA